MMYFSPVFGISLRTRILGRLLFGQIGVEIPSDRERVALTLVTKESDPLPGSGFVPAPVLVDCSFSLPEHAKHTSKRTFTLVALNLYYSTSRKPYLDV